MIAHTSDRSARFAESARCAGALPRLSDKGMPPARQDLRLHVGSTAVPWSGITSVIAAAVLAACGSAPKKPDTPTPSPAVDTGATGAIKATGKGRWVSAAWSELPGWEADNLSAAWPALMRSCDKPTPAWQRTCAAAKSVGPVATDEQVRSFAKEQLQPWRVETAAGVAEGLMTGYFEPQLEAARTPQGRFNVPLHAPPADLAQRKPWYTRAEISSLPAAQAALRGRELAYVIDPLDALMLQIQGSGRIAFTDAAGRKSVVRLAFNGHNDQPYQSVGRWLIEQKQLTADQANWPAIKNWARNNPMRIREMLNVNPRYVFFREVPLPDPSVGPNGAQGVPLTPGRSIAVDKESIPYGSLVWLASTEPQTSWAANAPASRPLQRLVVAQDTGSAITGAVRADYFWGWGDGAEDRAGRTRQSLKLWVLWPKG